MIEVKTGGGSLELPVAVQPGMADKTIMVELGYGRWTIGRIGEDVGFNAIKLMSKSGGMSPWIYSGASVRKTGGAYDLVTTQEHHSLNDEFIRNKHIERGIIQEASLSEYISNPALVSAKREESPTMYKNIPESDVKWAMAIDLNKCTGCDICSTACSIENNVPVVGKDQVAKGREMSWIRIDRYFSGTPEDPKVSYQPMLCQHCDNAPCENVCPVVATTHSADGLNQMTYNRCVGTRYCSNNCPYKVRRFNFFDFRDHFRDSYQYQESAQLINNPEVTVRSRGVMEKCTFCIQRIMEGRQEAIKENALFDGSTISTACQQACPAEAIVFGNINDPNSKVRKLADHNLGYKVLDGMNFKSNITYIKKLRNTKPEDKA
jgi:molybdopterin-containing oxidoreductase family iron-sulfur binding subunit